MSAAATIAGSSDAATAAHDAYFEHQLTESNAEFWRRMGDIDLAGLAVLDFGCGHGAMAIEAAGRGATRVLGVDLDEERIGFARSQLRGDYRRYAGIVDFACVDLAAVTDAFDIVLTKDALEHIEDLDGVLREIGRVLKPGGRLLAGFGPLYYSPFGDHGRFRGRKGMPWLPVLLPERLLFALASRWLGRPVRSATDLGLNKLTPRQFRTLVQRQGWRVDAINYNQGSKPLMFMMRWLRRVPAIEKYFTVSIYTVLKKV